MIQWMTKIGIILPAADKEQHCEIARRWILGWDDNQLGLERWLR